MEENKLFAENTLLDPLFKCHCFLDSRCFEGTKQALVSHCEKYNDSNAVLVDTGPAAPEMGSSVWVVFDRFVLW